MIMWTGTDSPPCSPDLNHHDFFLWGHLKEQVYQQTPQNLANIEHYIHKACQSISTDCHVYLQILLRLLYIISAQDNYTESVVI